MSLDGHLKERFSKTTGDCLVVDGRHQNVEICVSDVLPHRSVSLPTGLIVK